MGKRKKLAIVLSGGGARGAYQAGVFKSWQEILNKKNATFEIISGVSAGSINAMELVQNYHNLANSPQNLCDFWLSCQTHHVYDTKLRNVARNLFRLTRSSKKSNDPHEAGITHSVFDSAPLYQFLVRNVDMGQVYKNIQNNPQLSLIVNCFDYTNMKNTAFFQTEQNIESWERPTRRGIRTKLSTKHVVASCSVPAIFPTIEIDGHYYGDGSVRNTSPLNPVIKMGAERIICISLRGVNAEPFPNRIPSLGNVAEALLDSMFLDSVEYDSQVLNRMNILISQIPEEKRDSHIIDFCRISPYINFGELAENFRHKFPKSIHYLFGGWISSQLLSYLLFDKDYCEALIDQGYKDGLQFKDHVESWFLEEDS